MPPDAEKLRQRRYLPENEHVSLATVEARLVPSIQSLHWTEICIEGDIYDISSFDHPGGDQIKLFGGNDVTVQHHMIHPHHTTKHLEKMRKVGKVENYACKYKFDTPFERDVKEAVFAIVRRGQEFATAGWYFRAAVYLVLFASLQYNWAIRGSSFPLAIAYGISQALIGFNVSHDANHGACSGKHPWINDLFGFGTDLIAGNKWLWQEEEHWMHHAFTNDAEKDPDTRDAEPFIVFNNYPTNHPARKWYHRFQLIFYLPILACFWLSSVLNEELWICENGALWSQACVWIVTTSSAVASMQS